MMMMMMNHAKMAVGLGNLVFIIYIHPKRNVGVEFLQTTGKFGGADFCLLKPQPIPVYTARPRLWGSASRGVQ